MTAQNRRALTLTTLAVILAGAIAIFEPHRHILAALWPHLTSFWNTHIAF